VLGRPYLVYELVAGRSLDQRTKPVPWPRALELVLGVARGLSAAHRRDVLHRDIKPANVMLADSGEIKLLDFGLAKLLDGSARPDGGGAAGDGAMPSLPNEAIVEATLDAGATLPDGLTSRRIAHGSVARGSARTARSRPPARSGDAALHDARALARRAGHGPATKLHAVCADDG